MLTCCFLHHVRLLFLFLKLFVSARLLRSSSLIALLLRDSPIQSIYREASSRQSSLYFLCKTLFKKLIIPLPLQKRKCTKVQTQLVSYKYFDTNDDSSVKTLSSGTIEDSKLSLSWTEISDFSSFNIKIGKPLRPMNFYELEKMIFQIVVTPK